MDFLDRARRALNLHNDALADHRLRICKTLTALGALAMVPLLLMHLNAGRWWLALFNAVIGGLLAITAWRVHRARPMLIPYEVLGCVLITVVLIQAFRDTMAGVVWSYPALFLCFLIVRRSLATALGVVLTTGVSIAALQSLHFELAVRVFASQLFMLSMIHVVLNVIGELQQALVAQTLTDPLTGAFNRRHLESQLDQRVGEARREGDHALLIIDIDHFKRVNDTHGHDVGDEVLRRVVAAVSLRKRRSDLLFRLGGEEFVLLLPGANLEQAQAIAETLRVRLAEADLLPGETITVSIGVSLLGEGQSAEAWIKRADTALYEAKRSGRNRVVLAAHRP